MSRGPNRPPAAVGTLPDRTLALNATLDVDVSQAFVDPDGDALGYTVSSSVPDVVGTRVAGARVTLTAVGAGAAAIRVTATDPGGLTATQSFVVLVAANRPPVSVGALAPLTIGAGETAATVDVASAFRDPDGDPLTYGAISSAPAVASVSVSGSTVTATAVAGGTATVTVTVTATDTGGSNMPGTQTLTVTVSNRAPEPVGTLGP